MSILKSRIAIALFAAVPAAAFAQCDCNPPVTPAAGPAVEPPASPQAAAEKPPKPNLLSPSLWSYDAFLAGQLITLRQSSQDANNSGKAAVIQWTENNNGADSFAVDAALQAPFALRDTGQSKESRKEGYTGTLTFGPLAEYHRSTVTKKPIDSSSAGLSLDWINTWNPNRENIPGNVVPPQATDHILRGAVAYKNDRISKGQGIQAGVSYGLRAPWIGSAAPRGATTGLPWEYIPFIALQGEHADGLSDDGGEVYRGKASISAAAYPFAKVTSHPIAITADYSGWWNLSRSGTFEDYAHYQKLFVVGIQWAVLQGLDEKSGAYSTSADGNSAVSIALQYYAGANPEESKPSQSYTQLTLKLRL